MRYVIVSIPRAIAEKIDHLIEGLGYWPSKSSFVREACLEKVRVEIHRLEEFRNAVSSVEGSGRVEGELGGTDSRR